MSQAVLAPSVRVRRTPFSFRVEAEGVSAYTVYNHMLLPTCFRSLEEDCRHLKSAVQLWDVSCERQVEITGPDAQRLVQMTTPRDLARMQDDQCFYIPMVDAGGRILNDPVLIRLGEDRFRVSLSDSDMLHYFKGLAAGFGLDAEVIEPDVSPLAIQGPKADDVVAAVFGDEAVALRFFRHMRVEVAGRGMVLARSGWSHQGGFELYLEGTENGEAVWDMVMEAGRAFDIRAGCPNTIERIEGGLLSYGSDMTSEHTPLEAGLGRYCALDTDTGCLGRAALQAEREPARMVRPVEIHGDRVPPLRFRWTLEGPDGAFAGTVSSAIWSPDCGVNVAIAMIERDFLDADTPLRCATPDGPRDATVRDRFWR